MIHQRRDVGGHDGDLVGSRVVELGGFAMAAIVESNDAASAFLQLRNPGRINPVHVLGRGESMHEQDRIAFALVEIGNFNSAVMKTRHRSFRNLWRRKATRLRAHLPSQARWPPAVFATVAPFCDRATT